MDLSHRRCLVSVCLYDDTKTSIGPVPLLIYAGQINNLLV